MSIEKIKPEAGKGGKLGRSNMSYWGTNDEAKAAGRKLRRQAGRQAVEEGVADAVAPERTISRRKKRVARLLSLILPIVLSAMSVSAYAQQCLHGTNEAPDQTARRREALAATRTINNIQHNQPGAAQRSFFRHAQLGESPIGKSMAASPNELSRRMSLSPDGEILPGWRLTLDVTETGYWFMIKDTTDACGFAYISNHDGLIYTSEALR